MFNPQIQNDQCQEMDTTADKWVKLTDNGEWGSHSVSLSLFFSSPLPPLSLIPFPNLFLKFILREKGEKIVY